jgi:hypothetical protein
MLSALDAYLTGIAPHKVVGGTIVSSALLLAGEQKNEMISLIFSLLFVSHCYSFFFFFPFPFPFPFSSFLHQLIASRRHHTTS